MDWLRKVKRSRGAAPAPDAFTAALARGEAFGLRLREALADPRPEREKLRRLFDETSLADFWAYYIGGAEGPHYHIPWRGREMTRMPMDVLVYQEMLHATKPAWVLEIGTHRGISALCFADMVAPWGGRVVTMDILGPSEEARKLLAAAHVIFLEGDATRPQMAEQVYRTVNGHGCLVIDDGSHTYDDVFATFQLYARLVPPGGYYVVEDGFSNWLVGKSTHNALAAVDRLLVENPAFVREQAHDRFVLLSALLAIMRRRPEGAR